MSRSIHMQPAKSHSFLSRSFVYAGLYMLGIAAIEIVFGTEPVTITVHAGAQQTFVGYGAASKNREDYQQLPDTTRAALAKLVWSDLGFTYLRLYTELGPNDAAYAAYRYGKVVEDATKANPDLSVMLGPSAMVLRSTHYPMSYEEYAQRYAVHMRDLRDKHGIEIDATGVVNEPNENVLDLDAASVRDILKLVHKEMEKRDLGDIKIIAPETSNVDRKARDMVDSIIADPEALAALHAFGTHSYNMCMTRRMRDKVSPHRREYWQTESSGGGPEEFDDDDKATWAIARVLGDVNLGVTHWFWFIAYDRFDERDNTTRLIGFSPNGDYRAFLKYYYFKHLVSVIEPGTVMRNATTSLSYEKDVKYGSDRYRDMENTYGPKPPICAAAGIGPDSTWRIGITNYTGVVSDWSATSTLDSTSYDVTLHIEALEYSEDVAFEVIRSTRTSQGAREGTVTMSKGRVTVSIDPLQLVTLKATAPASVKPRWACGKPSMTFVRLAGKGLGKRLVVVGGANAHRIELRDMRGRVLMGRAIGSGQTGAKLNIGALSGTFVARVLSGAETHQQRIVVP